VLVKTPKFRQPPDKMYIKKQKIRDAKKRGRLNCIICTWSFRPGTAAERAQGICPDHDKKQIKEWRKKNDSK